MPDYSLGKIYKITSPHTNLVYIGSTTYPLLCQRLRGHVKNFRGWKQGRFHFVSSFIILELGDYQIELLERCPCVDKDELLAREQYHIREHQDVCCNRHRALSTEEEKKQEKKNDNAKYRANNKEAISQKKAEYYSNNKEAILEKANAKHQCDCGGRYTHINKGRHLKSTKHQQYLRAHQDRQNILDWLFLLTGEEEQAWAQVSLAELQQKLAECTV